MYSPAPSNANTPIIDSQTIGPATHLIIAIIINEQNAARIKPPANNGQILIVSSTIN